jgi:hypothetical protein
MRIALHPLHRGFAWLLVAGMSVFALAGCGGPHLYKVKSEVARQTLTQVLDQWKAGATPESLRSFKPEIVVQDMEWAGGAKLISYEVLDPGEARDANLVVKVKLTLLNPEDKESSKNVTYLVGTAPVLTVFRDMFQ